MKAKLIKELDIYTALAKTTFRFIVVASIIYTVMHI